MTKKFDRGESELTNNAFFRMLLVFAFVSFALNFGLAQLLFGEKKNAIDVQLQERDLVRLLTAQTSSNKLLHQYARLQARSQPHRNDSYSVHEKTDTSKKTTAERNKGRARRRQSPHSIVGVPNRKKGFKGMGHPLAGLNCDDHGGPSEAMAREMVYWEDIPSDSRYVSPFKKKQREGPTQYLTFDQESAGFNNIRLAVETMITLAIAMGRTLVLPPKQAFHQLKLNYKGFKDDEFTFSDFFPLQQVAEEHLGLEIITMQEFLEREALTGNLKDKDNRSSIFPPENRSNWDGVSDMNKLSKWLRLSVHNILWDPEDCMAAFATNANRSETQALLDLQQSIQNARGFVSYEAFIGKPFPVDAPTKDRMIENWAGRKKLCVYDEAMAQYPVIHFPLGMADDARMLVQFYSFLFFQDWKQDLWMKRFVRDHIRYLDRIQCAAARIVNLVRQRSQSRGNPNGEFDSFHIRRDDFKGFFKGQATVEAIDIYNISKEELRENATIYIATDERNQSYFDPLREHYDLLFLNDFHEELKNLSPNYYGMIDQLIASRGQKFFGCWYSTFTAYINRIRGYHANKAKAPGYEQGIIASWYYVPKDRYDFMRKFYPVKKPYYVREFPTSWRLIDQGVGELAES